MRTTLLVEFIFTLEMQLPSGINSIRTGCLACIWATVSKTFRQIKETTRKSPENSRRRKCEREHEEQDQAVIEKMSRED